MRHAFRNSFGQRALRVRRPLTIETSTDGALASLSFGIQRGGLRWFKRAPRGPHEILNRAPGF
eukprot:3409727-Pyramimonas_sp.AAC.1